MTRALASSIAFLAILCRTPLFGADDPLPSWNSATAKTAILKFVAAVTTSNTLTFVPASERIAVFDNDGTLWVEQPAYPQFQFGMDHVKDVQNRHPDWRTKEPFRSALLGDWKGVSASGVRGLNELAFGVVTGFSSEDQAAVVKGWLATSRHPRFDRPYTDCVYIPMLEVMRLLRTNHFKTFIVSGGAAFFLRPWTERIYGVPPEQVIATLPESSYELRHGKPAISHLAEIASLVDHEGKPLAIERIIGRRPIAAFGNSDGDLPMLEWTATGKAPALCVYVHHTDAEREYAYDRKASTGRLDKGLDIAHKNNWPVVNMKQDWNRIFSFQSQGNVHSPAGHGD